MQMIFPERSSDMMKSPSADILEASAVPLTRRLKSTSTLYHLGMASVSLVKPPG